MQLSVADLSELPLPAALLEDEGEVVVRTPEWPGAGPGCVAYPVRRKRLVVATNRGDATAAALLTELFDTLRRAAADAEAEERLRLRVLIASLQLLGGGKL